MTDTEAIRQALVENGANPIDAALASKRVANRIDAFELGYLAALEDSVTDDGFPTDTEELSEHMAQRIADMHQREESGEFES